METIEGPQGEAMQRIMKSSIVICLLGTAGLTAQAQADGLTPVLGGLYGGVAAAYTDVDNVSQDSDFGSHVYLGVDLLRLPPIARFGVEAGYLSTGRIETNGGTTRIENYSGSAMATLTTLPGIDLHARVGYEDGDTSGGFQAVGATVTPLPLLGVRAEYSNNNDFDAITLGVRLRFP